MNYSLYKKTKESTGITKEPSKVTTAISKTVERPKGKIEILAFSDREIVSWLSTITQYCNLSQIVNKIKTGVKYVVQVSPEYQKMIDNGTAFLNRNKNSGKMFATLMEMQPDGRWKFVDNLPIAEEAFVNGNPFSEIMSSFYNILLQKQINHISELAERSFVRLERIEQGQMDDRIALLQSGKKEILYSFEAKNIDEKNNLLKAGRDNLIKAQNMMGQTLKSRVERFARVPKSRIGQYFLVLGNKSALSDFDNEAKICQDYFEAFLEATKLVAATFLICNEPEIADTVFSQGIDFVNTINYDNIKTIQYCHRKIDVSDRFFFNSVSIGRT